MNKTILNLAITTILGAASHSAHAVLVKGDTLSITPITMDNSIGCMLDTGFPCVNLIFDDPVGSYFNISNNNLAVPISSNAGIILGTTQLADGGTSVIDFPWNPDIGAPFSGIGVSQTTSPSSILSNTQIDFSGWSVVWDGEDNINNNVVIPLGGDPENHPEDTGIAVILCGECNNGDAYTLDYSAHVAPGSPQFFEGAVYTLHLEGFISSVPIPATVWLFGSGLIGLIGLSRRKAHT